jgi:membrane-associated HD superfamily phosphohydrolase
VFDDPDMEASIKITYDGKENIIKFSKEEKISNVIGQFVSKFKINMQKVFFLYGGDRMNNEDLEKTFTQVTKNADDDNKMLNLLAYNRESTLSQDSGSDDGKEENINYNKDNDKIQNTNNNNNNEKIFENNNEKIFENNNEKIFENNNDKILNVEDNNVKICKNDSLKLDAENPDEENKNERRSRISYNDWNDLNIIKVYTIFLFQIILIGLLSSLGCLFKINLAFIASTSSMLWTFIPTIIFIFIIVVFYMFLYESEPNCFIIFNILFVPLMAFYCFLLTDYTEILYILFQLVIIFLDVLIMLLNSCIFKYSNGYCQNFFFPLIQSHIP